MKLKMIFFFLIAVNIAWGQGDLTPTKITDNSLQFTFQNYDRQNVILEYGLTHSLELGTVTGLTINNLEDATFYYAKAKTIDVTPYQETPTKLFATASKSSGKITVYFNQTVNNNASSLADAIHIPSFEDTLVAYIDRAQTSLDVCNYNTGSLAIVNAVNAAQSRGVDLRYIAADNTGTNNGELANLAVSIPMIQRPADGEVMHNKFMIIDVANTSRATIITGSTNHTNNSMHNDYNNLVIVQDQTLALAYKTEFEEMWGSATSMPNLATSKFGDEKTDNTPHNFNIGGTTVELYFSPSDGTTAKIEAALQSANTDLQFATLTYINNDLGDVVINRHQAGVDAKGIIENIFYFGSEYSGLKSAGVDVHSHFGTSHVFHHKYGIVDANNITSDPLVITGSHNWTNSAEDDFDENTLIIHDATIANMFYEEFMTRYTEVTGIPVVGVQVATKLLLQGSYNTGTGLMNDNLRALGFLPQNEPFTSLGFTHTGPGGGEATLSSIFDVIGADAIIDWVFLELRDAALPSTVVATRAALLQSDGDVVDLDGVSAVLFPGVLDGSYYLSVKSRNHLGVMSSMTISLTSQPNVVYDFTQEIGYGTNAQKTLPSGNFAFYEGDLTADGVINADDRSLAWNSRNQIGYLSQDSNLDGNCDAADRSQNWNNRNLISQIP